MGITKKVSNIHLESFKDRCIYRFEIEGKLSKEFDEIASAENLENFSKIIHIRTNPRIYDSDRAFRAAICVDPAVIMINRIHTKDFINYFNLFLKCDFSLIITTEADDPFEFMSWVQNHGVALKDLMLVKPLFMGVNFYDQICTECKEATSLSKEDRTWIEKRGFDASKCTVRKGKGCQACLYTGISKQENQEEILLIEDDVINNYRQMPDVITIPHMSESVIKIPDDQTIISRVLTGNLGHQSLSKIREAINKWNRT